MTNNSVHSFSDNNAKTLTLEFYLEDKQLFVRYNNSPYLFTDFWNQTEGAENTCRRIFEAFLLQHADLVNKVTGSSQNWLETFLKIINIHLGENTPVLDVFIRSNGDITFNLER